MLKHASFEFAAVAGEEACRVVDHGKGDEDEEGEDCHEERLVDEVEKGMKGMKAMKAMKKGTKKPYVTEYEKPGNALGLVPFVPKAKAAAKGAKQTAGDTVSELKAFVKGGAASFVKGDKSSEEEEEEEEEATTESSYTTSSEDEEEGPKKGKPTGGKTMMKGKVAGKTAAQKKKNSKESRG